MSKPILIDSCLWLHAIAENQTEPFSALDTTEREFAKEARSELADIICNPNFELVPSFRVELELTNFLDHPKLNERNKINLSAIIDSLENYRRNSENKFKTITELKLFNLNEQEDFKKDLKILVHKTLKQNEKTIEPHPHTKIFEKFLKKISTEKNKVWDDFWICREAFLNNATILTYDTDLIVIQFGLSKIKNQEIKVQKIRKENLTKKSKTDLTVENFRTNLKKQLTK
jgi:transposase